jgi:hypothetical protein
LHFFLENKTVVIYLEQDSSGTDDNVKYGSLSPTMVVFSLAVRYGRRQSTPD